jgi:hypothetical protein
MALSKTTQDHDEIRKWAEAHGAVPADVAATDNEDEPGILRFEFPKAHPHNDSALQEISWEDFFRKFDENGLALVYQEKTADGETSNFNKLVKAENAKSSSKSRSSSTTGKKSATAAKQKNKTSHSKSKSA